MRGPNDDAASYRKRAASCLEVAERMSLDSDRQRMIDMSLYWLEMAEKADALHGYASFSGKWRDPDD